MKILPKNNAEIFTILKWAKEGVFVYGNLQCRVKMAFKIAFAQKNSYTFVLHLTHIICR
jgi:hypothetical protein